MTDPKYWDMDIKGKLCFLLGYVQGEIPDSAVEYPNLGPAEPVELVDAIIRMFARKKGQLQV